jgi:hypothetical protein
MLVSICDGWGMVPNPRDTEREAMKNVSPVAHDVRQFQLSEIDAPRPELGQRPVDQERVDAIVKAYNPDLDYPIVVAKVRGYKRYQIADGGHRFAAAKERAKALGFKAEDAKMDVLLLDRELSVSEFAGLVADLNTKRKAMSAIEKFMSRIIAKEENAVAIAAILNDYKLKVGTGPENVTCARVLDDIYKDGGSERLRMALRLHTEAFNTGEPPSGMELRALGIFFSRYAKAVDMNHLVKRMKGFNLAHAITLSARASASGGDRFSILAEKILREYNKNRPGGIKRLRAASESHAVAVA